jgi:phosphoribosylamine--glycine ligase
MAVARVLVVGSGGRENALAWALARSQGNPQVWLAPGNGASAAISGCNTLAIDVADAAGLVAACTANQISLVVIGPEGPLAAGLADQLRAAGLAVFGPGADGAQLEASKQWAKQLMQEAGVPTADFWVVNSVEEGCQIARQLDRPLVVKADGLAAGKGVTVASNLEETIAAIQECFSGRFGIAGSRVVLEEQLSGPEVSVFALTDGKKLLLLPPAQDHKRIGEGDKGPNTGGMGAYAPAPLLDAAGLEQVRELVLEPVLAALRQRGISYRGVIYAGLMLTTSGIKVIEFNCRFGDPECQTLMPLLEGDLAAVFMACAEGKLESAPPLTIKPLCSACVVAAAANYPGEPRLGDLICDLGAGLNDVEAEVSQLFFAGVKSDQTKQLKTSGGRVLAAVAQADDFDSAFAAAYKRLAEVSFAGMQLRRDIGHQVRHR